MHYLTVARIDHAARAAGRKNETRRENLLAINTCAARTKKTTHKKQIPEKQTTNCNSIG